MNQSQSSVPVLCLLRRACFLCGMALFSASSFGETVIISSRPADGSAGTTLPPLYEELAGNWANSTLKSSAPGLASIRLGSRFATTGTPEFRVNPTLATTNGTYFVEVTHGSATSISADIIVGIT